VTFHQLSAKGRLYELFLNIFRLSYLILGLSTVIVNHLFYTLLQYPFLVNTIDCDQLIFQ